MSPMYLEPHSSLAKTPVGYALEDAQDIADESEYSVLLANRRRPFTGTPVYKPASATNTVRGLNKIIADALGDKAEDGICLGQFLQKGGQASVFSGFISSGPQILAVKTAIKIEESCSHTAGEEPELRSTFETARNDDVKYEASLMWGLEHEHIVSLISVLDTTLGVFMNMEYMNCGSLYDFVRINSLSVKQALLGFRQLLSAGVYVHELNLAHRDIKPGNILIARDEAGTLTFKLADFGFATHVPKRRSRNDGGCTWQYRAPEALSGPNSAATSWPVLPGDFPYAIAGDIHAIGLVGTWLFNDYDFRTRHFSSHNDEELFKFFVDRALDCGRSSRYLGCFSESSRDNMTALFPSRRPTAETLLLKFDSVYPSVNLNCLGDIDVDDEDYISHYSESTSSELMVIAPEAPQPARTAYAAMTPPDSFITNPESLELLIINPEAALSGPL